MKLDPLAGLALVGASLAAIGIALVASSSEPPRVAPVSPTSTIERAPAVESPPPALVLKVSPTPGPQPQVAL
jgi:hypothetical protein